jgi:hypothetical protein
MKKNSIKDIDDHIDIKVSIYPKGFAHIGKCLKPVQKGNNFSTVHHKGMLHNAIKLIEINLLNTIVAH